MSHTCHAKGCTKVVPEAMLMCRAHWNLVPFRLKKNVWAWYRKGQEITKTPTREYLNAAKAAIEAVAELEGR